MYRYKDCKYGEYKTEHEAKQLYLALPEDIDVIRQSFEDLFRSQSEDSMYDISYENEKYEEGKSEEYKYIVKIGWHTPFELFFEATNIYPSTDTDRSYDRVQYRSIIGSMLSAKYGEPIGFKFTKLIQVGQNVIEYYPEFYGIFKSICYYYGNLNLLREQDKNRKLANKEKNYESKISVPEHSFNKIIEFLCPKLNGRLTYGEIHGQKAKSDDELNKLFTPVKFFTILLDPNTKTLGDDYIVNNSKECFKLIKHYLKSRDYQSLYYDLKPSNTDISSKITHFILNVYTPDDEDRLNIYNSKVNYEYEKQFNNLGKLVNLHGLNDYIIDGMYDSYHSCCLHLNFNFRDLTENQILDIKKQIEQILQLTVGRYELDGKIGRGCIDSD